MKRPQRRGKNGQFVAKAAEKRAIREGHLRDVARGARRGVLDRLVQTDPALAAALRKFRRELLAEFGPDRATATAVAMVNVIAQSRLLLDSIDAVLLELGPKIINKSKRQAYPLLKQRQELADSLTEQLAALNALKMQGDFDQRLERLEDLRLVGP